MVPLFGYYENVKKKTITQCTTLSEIMLKSSNLNTGKRNALNTEQVREGQIHSGSPHVDTNGPAHRQPV